MRMLLRISVDLCMFKLLLLFLLEFYSRQDLKFIDP